MKTFDVEIYRYPEVVTVQAESEEEAIKKARAAVSYAPYSIFPIEVSP